MSGSGRGTPTTSPTRRNSRASSWASSHSAGSGHVSAGLLGPAAVLRHRAQPDPAGPGDGPVGQALLVLQSKNLADLSHQ